MFTLIQDDDMWVISKTSSWVNYVLVEGIPTVNKISGLVEPYQDGETSMILPSGITAQSAKVIYTEHELNVYSNIQDNLSTADIITLRDPEESPTAYKYMILSKEDWDTNSSFSLIPSHNVYLAVRVEQQ